jgi:uncharacterized membrane protein YidH (DUF202 family)
MVIVSLSLLCLIGLSLLGVGLVRIVRTRDQEEKQRGAKLMLAATAVGFFAICCYPTLLLLAHQFRISLKIP